MNPTPLEEALLLRDSGELTETQRRELEAALHADPALRALADEWQLLQRAGAWASLHTTPTLPELHREKILVAARRPAPRLLPRLLAAAALLLLGVGLWPHLSGPWNTPPQDLITLSSPHEIPAETLLALETDFPELEVLSEKLHTLADFDPSADLSANADAELWAVELLALEESI